MADVKKKTIEKTIKRLRDSGVPLVDAHQMVIESAKRINEERRGQR